MFPKNQLFIHFVERILKSQANCPSKTKIFTRAPSIPTPNSYPVPWWGKILQPTHKTTTKILCRTLTKAFKNHTFFPTLSTPTHTYTCGLNWFSSYMSNPSTNSRILVRYFCFESDLWTLPCLARCWPYSTVHNLSPGVMAHFQRWSMTVLSAWIR